jgi:sec-independent protein translocase protein TatB
MFGISFTELLLVGLVALLVLGPERLPGAARTAGLWIGRLKRSFNAIKTEVEREIGADEIRRQLHNEHILSLEQEARKILNPQSTPAKPAPSSAVADAAPTTGHEVAPTSVPATSTSTSTTTVAAPSEPADAALDALPTPPLTPADAASSETVPTPKPPTETSLPPRAP